MRADERGAVGAFTVASLREFHGEITFHTGQIFEPQFLGVVGNAAIREARERGKFRHEFAAGADDFIAELHEFGGKTFECGLVHDALFEQGISRADGVHVALEQRQIKGIGLCEQQINETPPRARRAFDELQIFREKTH